MKKYSYITVVFYIIISFCYSKSVAQEVSSNLNERNYILTQIQLNNNPSLILENKIYSEAELSAQNSSIKLNQIGNYNQIDIKADVTDSQLVNQIGNQNNYTFINYYNNTPSNFDITQLGNANFLQIYGENSIIKNLKIVQKSNAKTIIIRNY
ncbi:hypothetical protein Lupro_12000 [Lutibacter profundi]|uniref:Curlin associated repeat-containing protein n=1 Tax=Lutibacter profundi TaxID=1622118 RepID=A0A0X8G8E9_9FLAO|nr:hypothetical protein [Lutibacter profundi]AMC11945.1 hypothetical protein Lupro_12000 [Lutibacter profundi]